jgi:hypothetical protein
MYNETRGLVNITVNCKENMQVIKPEWTWYIANFVMAIDFDGDDPHEYQIYNYLIQAKSPDAAYEKCISLTPRLDDSIRNDFGEVENYKCIGLYNLDVVQDAVLEDRAHLSTIDILDVSGNPPKPRIRSKEELYVFT